MSADRKHLTSSRPEASILSRFGTTLNLTENQRTAYRQRTLAVLIFGAVAAFAVGAVLMTEPPAKKRLPGESAVISLRPESADRETFVATYEAKLLALEREIAAVKADAAAREANLRTVVTEQAKTNETLTRDLSRMEKSALRLGILPKPGESPEESQKRFAETQKSQDGSGYSDKLFERFGSNVPGPVYSNRADGSLGRNAKTSGDTLSAPALPDTSHGYGSPGTLTPSELPDGRRLQMVTLAAPAAQSDEVKAKPVIGPAPHLQPDAPLARNRAAGTRVTDYIPAGAFVKTRLLTGVYAATGAGAASQPLPMVLRIDDKAVLPNAWRTNVKACHLTASATGDLSSERVFVRLDRLACVGKKGETLDVRVTGYVVGEDGKVGIRGKLVTRSGQAIASALSVGVLSGIGSAVSRSSEEVTTSITGTQSTRYKNAWASGLGEGLSSAMDRITDYYLKLADRIFPVLEVDAGRSVDVVFSQGVLLSEGERR